MELNLPEEFADDMNELLVLLRHYDLCADDEIKDQLMRKTLDVSCELLGSIDLDALSARIEELFREVHEYERSNVAAKPWADEIFAKPSHFHKYLDETEDQILKSAGIKAENRKRIISAQRQLRLSAHLEAANMGAAQIVSDIRALKDDVCRLKNAQVEPDQRGAARDKALKTALAGAAVANAAGSDAFPLESPAVAASVVLGAVAQR